MNSLGGPGDGERKEGGRLGGCTSITAERGVGPRRARWQQAGDRHRRGPMPLTSGQAAVRPGGKRQRRDGDTKGGAESEKHLPLPLPRGQGASPTADDGNNVRKARVAREGAASRPGTRSPVLPSPSPAPPPSAVLTAGPSAVM